MKQLLLNTCLLGLLILLPAGISNAQEGADEEPTVGLYENIINVTKATLDGQFGFLAQAVRIPKSLFLSSPCQIVYLANPDWTTSQVHVDFGAASTSSASNGACQQQAFLAYIDNYNDAKGVSGANKANNVAWTSLLTAPRTDKNSVPAMPKHITADPGASSNTSGSGVRRRSAMEFARPLDRYAFKSPFDNVRDDPFGSYNLWVATRLSPAFIPAPGSAISKPTLSSSLLQQWSYIPSNSEPFLDFMEGKYKISPSGELDPSTEELAGASSGAAKVFSPLMHQECLDILRLNAMASPSPSTFTSASGATTTTLGGSSPPQDQCFVTQQVVVVYNNCPAAEAAEAEAANTTVQAAPPRRAADTCARAMATRTEHDRLACLLEIELERVSYEQQEEVVGAEEDFVKVTVTYKPYDGCYKRTALELGQASNMLVLLSAGLMVLFIIFVLAPTLFRLFIEFPVRALVHLIRKVAHHGRVEQLPLQSELHSHKEPLACMSWLGRVPVLAQMLWLRKQLVYTVCTVHNPNGQFRSLQVAVTSVVALMIVVVAYPPTVNPSLDFFIPPLTFRIVKWSGDPLMTVWFLLQLLAFSLYLGFVGYMCMLSNYNTPRNKYYWVQSGLSVFWMLFLNALVLVQVVGVLWYWDNLRTKWPWLPMSVFLLGNLILADVLMVIICFSSRDRNDERHHREYLALLAEVADRERRAEARREQRRAAHAAKKKAAAVTADAVAAITAGGPSGSGSRGVGQPGVVVSATAAAPSDPNTPSSASSSDETLPRREGGGAAPVAPEPLLPAPPQPQPPSQQAPPRSQSRFRPQQDPAAQPPLLPQPSGGIGRHRNAGPGPVAEGTTTITNNPLVLGGGGYGGGMDGGSARHQPYLASSPDEGDSGLAMNAVKGSYYDVCGTGGGAAATGAVRNSDGGSSSSSRSSGSFSSSRRAAAAAAGGSGGWWGAARSKLRRLLRPLSEDAGFRYPAWFLASLLVAAYALVFTYAKAMVWARIIEGCIGDPTECLNQNLSKYVLFASRAASRETQTQIFDSVMAVAATRDGVTAAVGAALNSSNASLLVFDPTVTAALSNLSAPLRSSSSSSSSSSPLVSLLDASNLTSLQESISAALIARLQLNITDLVTSTLGGEAASQIPPDTLASVQSRVASAVQDTVQSYTGAVVSQMVPAALQQQTAVLLALNSSLDPVYNSIDKTTQVMGTAIKVQQQLLDWKDGLHRRFLGCSAAGFTLGLLLGLYSLVQIAVSFRRSSRRMARERLVRRFFLASPAATLEALEGPPQFVPLEGTVAAPGEGADGPTRPDPAAAAVAAAAARREKTADHDHDDHAPALLEDPDSIAFRAHHENIANVVYFIGVLLSTAVIQLYVVGVSLTVAAAIVTHPWLWSWCLPRYYMWLVAIIIALVVNKVLLIAYIGGTWLSNGDRIHRPAAWLAFLVVASATNLIIGLLLAAFRIVFLLLTTIFTLGKLDVTIFTVLSILDLPHRTFLAGLHLQESMSRFDDPIYLPGPRGRAHRRWRKLRAVVLSVPAEDLRRLLYGAKGFDMSYSKSGVDTLMVQVMTPDDEAAAGNSGLKHRGG